MPTTPKWGAEKVIGARRFYARATRSEIIVRIENDGDTTRFAEFGYPPGGSRRQRRGHCRMTEPAPVMWAVVEIMGRRQRAGRISDATMGGATLLRVEHPTRVDDEGQPVAEYYSPAALFAIRPCTEAEAIAANRWSWPDPRPELGPGLPAELEEYVDDDSDSDDGQDDDDPEPF